MENTNQGDGIMEKELTEREAELLAKKEAQKVEWARMKKNLRDNLNVIVEAVQDVIDEQTMADLLKCIGKERGKGGAKKVGKGRTPAVWKQVVDLLQANGGVATELDIFMKLKIGEARMKTVMAEAIKKAPTPEERVYITFAPATENEDFGTYTIVAIGEEPEGWDGYKPVDEEEEI